MHFLQTLYKQCQEDPQAIIIRDLALEKESTREKLLLDTLAFRDRLSESLDAKSKTDLQTENTEVFICVLLPPGHAFLQAFLAVTAVGAVAAPLCESLGQTSSPSNLTLYHDGLVS